MKIKLAHSPIRKLKETKLLVLSPLERKVSHFYFGDLPKLLSPGDLLVVNDSATLPASLAGTHSRSGRQIELRLAQALSSNPQDLKRWKAILFGEGDWRSPTEKRPSPPLVSIGDEFLFQSNLRAHVSAVSERFSRFIEVEFQSVSGELLNSLYRVGKPIQYSYLEEELKIWDQQTIFSSVPTSVEPPSASFPMSWELFFELTQAGVNITSITHSAGLSNTGDPELDKSLPLPERYWISEHSANLINNALSKRNRIIALGSTVTRALESAGRSGRIQAGSEITDLVLSRGFKRQIVSGILTGLHEPGASHLRMLASFIEPELLMSAYEDALRKGYLWHEYGDSCLILTAP